MHNCILSTCTTYTEVIMATINVLVYDLALVCEESCIGHSFLFNTFYSLLSPSIDLAWYCFALILVNLHSALLTVECFG